MDPDCGVERVGFEMEEKNGMQRLYHTALLSSLLLIMLNCESPTQQPTILPADTLSFDRVLIPAGEFLSFDGLQLIDLDYDYRIMRYELTIREYVDYLQAVLDEGLVIRKPEGIFGYYRGDSLYEAGEYIYYHLNHPANHIGFWEDSLIVTPGYEDHPLGGISWFGALAFAEYYGGSLPTCYEWVKAATGLSGYEFPWGEEFDSCGDSYDNGSTPVGYYNGEVRDGYPTLENISQYGLYDMAGNISEYTTQLFRHKDGIVVTTLGGDWACAVHHMRAWDKLAIDPLGGHPAFGLRVIWREE